MNRLKQLKVNPIISGLVILIMLSVTILVWRSIQSNQANNNNTSTTTQAITPTQVAKKDTTSLDINGKTFHIPTGWNLSAVFSSPEGTNYSCTSDLPSCSLALITNDAHDAALDKVIISWPGPVQSNFAPIGEPDVTKFTFLGESDNYFTVYKYLSGDAVTEYSQIYGCASVNVCIQADLLEADPDQNAKQLADFKNFIKEFKLQ